MLKIIKYSEKYFKDIVSCIEKLQDFIIEIDPHKLNIRTENYWENAINNLLEKVKKENWIIYVAIFDEKVVWFIAWVMWFTEDEYKDEFKYVKMWYILELFIDENYRWQKIWQLLMEEIERYFKENDCEYSYVNVFAQNIWAWKFYEKSWFSNRMISMSKKI